MQPVKDVVLTDELRRYMIGHGTPPDPVAEALGPEAQMQVPPEQGALLTLLALLLSARHLAVLRCSSRAERVRRG
ncbi:hypothetical protein [Streptomyces candidus]|uniref:Uncharacterized protein n=1 Tax=Streptomyces candidus TaxID=67283 RepID=A0A7X0HKR4_9ACTN|nr:hypothetical protein [Streptomyces candidus]MBB6439476.1 hypothetical protein [Streptomyces candidus]GHH56517.1 hypothetical protein GCM10018773_62590 [Streptomyces candidus]